MAGDGAKAGAGAEIFFLNKGGAEKEPEPKMNNFGSATLLQTYRYLPYFHCFSDFSNFRKLFQLLWISLDSYCFLNQKPKIHRKLSF